MQTLHDPAFQAVASEFISDIPLRLDAIRSGFQAGDLKATRTLSHQLKGAGGGFGFAAISQRAADLQSTIDNSESRELIERAISDLEAACEEASTAYRGVS